MLAAVALVFSACDADDAIEEVRPSQPIANEGDAITFSGTIAEQLNNESDDDATRLSIDGTQVVAWETGDQISVSDGTLNYTYTVENGGGSNCTFVAKTGGANFTIEDGTQENTFNAFYPASAVLGWNGNTLSTMIYTEQDYNENKPHSTADTGVAHPFGPYMVARAETTGNGANASFSFYPIASVIDVDLSGLKSKTALSGKKVASVSIYAKNKVSLAGMLKFDLENKAFSSIKNDETTYHSSTQSDVVTVSNININVNDLTSNDIVRFYVLPVKITNGVVVTVRLTDSDGENAVYYAKNTDNPVGTQDAPGEYSKDETLTTLCKPYYKKYTASDMSETHDWMATIPGSTYFSMLSTPGAHDAATSKTSTVAKCQNETIEELLANGVRAFDIRPGYKYSTTITTENLYIYHGMYNTNVLYKDAIKDMVEFLAEHPSEALSVIMVKEDGTPLLSSWTDYTTEMCNAIDAIHTQYTDYLKLLEHSYYTLNDYRGKIFFGYRNAWDLHKTVRITNWPDDGSVTNYGVGVGGQCTACVEDAYNTSGNSKKTVVNALLDMASANTDHKRFHFTFTSVANSITSSANTQNPAAATYIGTLTGPTGYVYADFMGSSSYSGMTLLKAIVAQNYKYVYKGRTRCGLTTGGTGTGVEIKTDEYADDSQVYSKRSF